MGSRPSNLGAASEASAASAVAQPAANRSPSAAIPSTRPAEEARRTGGQWAMRRAHAYASGRPDELASTPLPRRRSGGAVTPSTFTPGSDSRPLSSLATPDADSAANSEAACSDGFDARQPVTTERRLVEARQRADDSLEALRLELKGFGGALAVRYASWPAGAAVEVMCAVGSAASSSQFEITQGGSVPARLVRYLAAENSFEVRLRDGSTRVVPAQRVRRVNSAARQPPRPPRPPTPELLS
uniref:Uncharacterized protein n=1 Tax=Alexandrium monilatum TaxID=311494 RepID=A0A7S4Q3M1_9DINO|mmetsp:Transcript_80395/g.239500  ORF Transcript_80395/g.239500 Transcript_80395/m.239500 type:complete len:243 (+) Transcript_80395:72-800(+)